MPLPRCLPGPTRTVQSPMCIIGYVPNQITRLQYPTDIEDMTDQAMSVCMQSDDLPTEEAFELIEKRFERATGIIDGTMPIIRQCNIPTDRNGNRLLAPIGTLQIQQSVEELYFVYIHAWTAANKYILFPRHQWRKETKTQYTRWVKIRQQSLTTLKTLYTDMIDYLNVEEECCDSLRRMMDACKLDEI